MQIFVHIFGQIFINNAMIITSEMTGKELERIFFEWKKNSKVKLTAEMFASRLNIKKTKLYAEFGKVEIDAAVEKKVLADPELSGHRTLVKVDSHPETNESASNYPGLQLWEKTIEMLNETLKLIVDDNRHIKEDSRHIKKDGEVFRAIVEKGIEQGVISFKAAVAKK